MWQRAIIAWAQAGAGARSGRVRQLCRRAARQAVAGAHPRDAACAFFAAARISVPASILAVTVVEWLATERGIGQVMALWASLSDYHMLWSPVAVVAVLSAVGYGAAGALERVVLRRNAPEQLT